MASLSNHADGRRTIYTSGPRRPKIALGRIPKKQAEAIVRHVEALEVAAIDSSPPPKATAEWLAGIDAKLRDRLVRLGLCEESGRGRAVTLGHLIDRYRKSKFPNYKPGTVQVHEQTIASLEKHWRRDTPLRLITGGDAEDFREKLIGDGLAEATVRKRCAIASKFLRYAIKHRLLDRNPFEDGEVPLGNTASPHSRYVGEADAKAVLDKLPGTQWPLLFALSRWGGLRVGSEPRRLRWRDIDFIRGRIVVHSPKTERYAGRETRVIPLFDELDPLLTSRLGEAQEAEEAAPDDLVLPVLSGRTDASLRKWVELGAKRAGVEQWPRLWHNLRASRQTDLERQHPSHVVCAWLGNSKQVADKHYLMVTDEDFDRAQNRAQRVPETGRSDTQPKTGGASQSESPQSVATRCSF